jgi:hypothetical protein
VTDVVHFDEQGDVLMAQRIRKLTRVITFADLASGTVNGASVDIALGLQLAGLAGQQQPTHRLLAGAVLLQAPAAKLNTQFTGGGATAVGVTIGTAASPTVIATSFDVRGGAASGLFVSMAQGTWRVVPADSLIIARFTPDAGHALSLLTAGSVELSVYFAGPIK